MPSGKNRGVENLNHTAKKVKLLEYLSDPKNDWPNRRKMAKIIEVTPQGMYKVFTLVQLKDIEMEALKLRRATYAPQLAAVDRALLSKAQEGDVAACKLAYQRFEEWFESKMTRLADSEGEPLSFIMNIGEIEGEE